MSAPAKDRPALCRKCGKSDCVLVIDALAATTVAHVGGARVEHAPVDVEVPERWVVVCCTRCKLLLGLPVIEQVTA